MQDTLNSVKLNQLSDHGFERSNDIDSTKLEMYVPGEYSVSLNDGETIATVDVRFRLGYSGAGSSAIVGLDNGKLYHVNSDIIQWYDEIGADKSAHVFWNHPITSSQIIVDSTNIKNANNTKIVPVIVGSKITLMNTTNCIIGFGVVSAITDQVVINVFEQTRFSYSTQVNEDIRETRLMLNHGIYLGDSVGNSRVDFNLNAQSETITMRAGSNHLVLSNNGLFYGVKGTQIDTNHLVTIKDLTPVYDKIGYKTPLITGDNIVDAVNSLSFKYNNPGMIFGTIELAVDTYDSLSLLSGCEDLTRVLVLDTNKWYYYSSALVSSEITWISLPEKLGFTDRLIREKPETFEPGTTGVLDGERVYLEDGSEAETQDIVSGIRYLVNCIQLSDSTSFGEIQFRSPDWIYTLFIKPEPIQPKIIQDPFDVVTIELGITEFLATGTPVDDVENLVDICGMITAGTTLIPLSASGILLAITDGVLTGSNPQMFNYDTLKLILKYKRSVT